MKISIRTSLLAMTGVLGLMVGPFSFGLSSIRAAVGAVAQVTYSPTIKEVQGQVPYGATYTLEVQSPNNLAGAATITFSKEVNGFLPAGVSEATSLGYVQVTPAQLTFTAANQKQYVTVNFAVPSGAIPGQYGYQLKAVGWPEALGASNVGSSINATVSLLSLPSPPTVNIESPVDDTPNDPFVVITPPGQSFPIDIPVRFVADAPGSNPSSVITAVDADVNGTPITGITTQGMNSLYVIATATFRATAYGTYTVNARATNSAGTASDESTIKIQVGVAPPVASFDADKPKVAAVHTYTYYAGLDPLVSGVDVPVVGRGTTTIGGIKDVKVTLNDGSELLTTKTGLATPGTLTATASTTRRHSTAGEHTLKVVATDIYDQISAPATVTYKVEVKNPIPDVTNPLVSSLTDGVATSTDANGVTTFTLPLGATTMNVKYAFNSTSNAPFIVNSVAASLNGTSLPAPTTLPAFATASSTRSSDGVLSALPVGTYSISATCTSAGLSDQAATQFSIRASSLVPPSVVFNSPTPADRASFNLSSGSFVEIPVHFTGTSNNATTVISSVTAKVNNTSIATLTTSSLNQKTVTGSAPLRITAAGTYTVRVTAVDAVGTATAERTYYVTAVSTKDITGEVFFDVDRDRVEDADEFGLRNVTVRLMSGSMVIKTAVTNACGYYKFEDVVPGSYTVSAVTPTGFDITTIAHSVKVTSSDVQAPDIGLGLHFPSIRGMTATGFTIGYWKNNLDKAIAGKTSGTQVSKATLCVYAEKIGDFALSPYDGISLKTAASTMGYTGSTPSLLLSKQLMASEFNYQNGAYLNGNATLTFCFLYWGESVLKNSAQYSPTYLTFAKDWFDAYNNSHGGAVLGPQ